MKLRKSQSLRRRSARNALQSGVSLIETMVALAILLIVSIGILSLSAVALETTENQGHLEARAAEYAQDKMEQLMSLAYADGDTPTAGQGSDTIVFPACSPISVVPPPCTTGTGLYIGGSSDPAAPVNKYVDYLDNNGNALGGGTTAPAGWFYIRVWQISSQATNLKKITVTAQVRSGIGTKLTPTATVVSLKAFPF
jgi:prepilin-type N-terminal cleavage/methylation domain-containing protein